MIHVGVTAPRVEEAVSNRECNEPRIVRFENINSPGVIAGR